MQQIVTKEKKKKLSSRQWVAAVVVGKYKKKKERKRKNLKEGRVVEELEAVGWHRKIQSSKLTAVTSDNSPYHFP